MQIKRLYERFMDLAPHMAKLIPILERLVTGTNFSSALVGGAAGAAAVDLTGVHGRLDEAGKAHTALLRQMQDQTLQIAGVEEEIKRLRMALEHSERRVELELSSLGLWVKALGVTAIVLLAVLAVMFYVLHAK
jgi:hypothetical protein